MLGLGVREAEELRGEVVSRAYRRALREAFQSGRLDAAPSKAEVLGDLCDSLAFDSEAAAALHKQLYREKLTSLAEKKRLSDEDAAELDRLRRLLCLPKADVEALHRDICGRVFQEAVEDAMKAGIDRFGFAERRAVDAARRDMRVAPRVAAVNQDAAARKAFLGFISRSRTKANRLDAAKELKALVFFSNIVVAPLLEDLKVGFGCFLLWPACLWRTGCETQMPAQQKEEEEAKRAKQAEVEEAQKKIAEIMVEAQAQVCAVVFCLLGHSTRPAASHGACRRWTRRLLQERRGQNRPQQTMLPPPPVRGRRRRRRHRQQQQQMPLRRRRQVLMTQQQQQRRRCVLGSSYKCAAGRE
jgi:hypothetical protein